jgi:hypothetical protein
MRPTWWSQPFPPEGSVASDGITKQLGTPLLDPLVVLLRETCQNSWDARLDESGGVRLAYTIGTIETMTSRAMTAILRPDAEQQTPDFEEHLRPGCPILLVADRGTAGLDGPLRSDTPLGQDSANFVNFLRNVGEARDRAFGGGTYGFGKGILFRISQPSTIVVDTVCRHEGGLQRRIMGAALGPTFVRDNRRHTGRHWWGQLVDDVIEPFVGTDADEVAQQLGFGGFAAGETGTDIYVVGPDFGATDEQSRSPLEAGRLLASAAAWYLWPKLVDRWGRRPIDLEVTVDGEQIEVPNAAHSRRLRPFANALALLDVGGGKPFNRRRHEAGRFAVDTDLVVPVDDPIVDLAAPFSGPAHHCARMRSVELIVDYFEGPVHPDPATQYGAVFCASSDVDDLFALAEPPTHDAWVTEHLTGTARDIVTRARRFVLDQFNVVVGETAGSSGGYDVPLGRLSSSLAKLLPVAVGDGGGSAEGGGGRGGDSSGGGGGPTVSTEGEPRLALHDDEPRIVQNVRFVDATSDLAARAGAEVAVDGGRERSAPTGEAVPIVLGWASEDGRWVDGSELLVTSTAPRKWTIHVRPAPHTSTIVTVRAVAGSNGAQR